MCLGISISRNPKRLFKLNHSDLTAAAEQRRSDAVDADKGPTTVQDLCVNERFGPLAQSQAKLDPYWRDL